MDPVTVRLTDDEKDTYLRWHTAKERCAQWKAVADEAEKELKLIVGIKPDTEGETPPVVAVDFEGAELFRVTPYTRSTLSKLFREERPDLFAQYQQATWVRSIKPSE